MNILVTGGAGYIGSHTVVKLLERGDEIVIVDDFSNSDPVAIDRIKQITGKTPKLYRQDLRDQPALDSVFEAHAFEAVIHFAGLKSVGESVTMPLHYYQTNLGSTMSLLESMKHYDVRKLVFSSSATVYGNPASLPITEEAPLSTTNPYGETKLMIERILEDVAVASNWNITSLRYFNPVGAHPSGLIGENPNGIPNNLLPFVTQVAIGKLDHLSVFGGDYDTPDGTGVRDYIHVQDLADAHLSALDNLDMPGYSTFNIGTGAGVSVLEIIKAFEAASGKTIPYDIVERRDGDIASCYADASKAKRVLGWHATLTLEQACRDSWLWQSQNPSGYSDSTQP